MSFKNGIRFLNAKEYVKAWEKKPELIAVNLYTRFKVLGRNLVQYMRTHHRFKSHQGGTLEKSLKYSVSKKPIVLKAGVPKNHEYGRYVVDGTRPHWIEPVNRQTLRFIEGGFIFAKRVLHPGTDPDPFVTNAVKYNKTMIGSEVDMAVQASLDGRIL